MVAAGLLLVMLVVGALWAVSTFRSYLASDSLRKDLENRLSARLGGARVEVAPLAWSGAQVRVSKVRAWEEAKADGSIHGLQAGLDWSALKRQTVRVTELHADAVEIEFAGIPAAAPKGSKPAASRDVDELALADAPSGWRAWLPNRVEVDHISVDRVDAVQTQGRHPIKLTGGSLEAEPSAGETAWNVKLGDTGLEIGRTEQGKLGVRSASLRVDPTRLYVNDAQAEWMGGSDVSARGYFQLDSGQVDLSGTVRGLDVLKLVGEAWKGKLSGSVQGDFHLSMTPGEAMKVSGHAVLKEGFLKQLPVLDRVATYTRVDRFRRVVLDVAEADYTWTPGAVVLRKLVLQSNGLIRVEGDLSMRDGNLSGTLAVGVTSETLQWIPGAERRVFVEPAPSATSPAGYVWTTVRLGGTTAAPTEDLSRRLVEGVGTELLLSPVETATKVLDGVGKEPLDKTGTELIEGAADTVKKGLDAGTGLLRGILPGR